MAWSSLYRSNFSICAAKASTHFQILCTTMSTWSKILSKYSCFFFFLNFPLKHASTLDNLFSHFLINLGGKPWEVEWFHSHLPILLWNKLKAFIFRLCYTSDLSLPLAYCQVWGFLCSSLFCLAKGEGLVRWGWLLELRKLEGRQGLVQIVRSLVSHFEEAVFYSWEFLKIWNG